MVESALSGRTLRAGIPLSEYPDHFMVDDEGQPLPTGPYIPGAPMSGLWIDYYEEMAKIGNFELEYRPVSNSSLRAVSSSWSACVMDVAAGILDVCVANVWLTPEVRAPPHPTLPNPTQPRTL